MQLFLVLFVLVIKINFFQIFAPEALTVLMSALHDDALSSALSIPPGTRPHHFRQPVPIPTYLIAIAVGHLESRQIGPRSRVWSERELVDLAAFEFDQVSLAIPLHLPKNPPFVIEHHVSYVILFCLFQTEMFLQTAEQLCGPYVWGQYDLLVLPSSFPFGGMENPCITFVTPTLLVCGHIRVVNEHSFYV